MLSLMEKARAGAWRYARMYSRQGLTAGFDDFLSAAHLGLVIAARKFDPTRGVTFYTYAFQWMDSKLQRVVMEEKRQSGWAYNHLKKDRDSGESGMERLVRVDQWPVDKDDGHALDVAAPLANPRDEYDVEDRRRIVMASARNQRERVILQGRLQGKHLEDIAAEIGLTRQRVHQLLGPILERARRHALASKKTTSLWRDRDDI